MSCWRITGRTRPAIARRARVNCLLLRPRSSDFCRRERPGGSRRSRSGRGPDWRRCGTSAGRTPPCRTSRLSRWRHEFSRGLHAENGGSWGQIGQPLQPPYDTVSKLIFEFDQGQCSEPLETPTGWYIVKCGKVQAEQRRSFGEVQEEIRQQLVEQQLNRLTVRYIVGLAEKATISSPDQFIAAAVRLAATEPWSRPPERAQQLLLP